MTPAARLQSAVDILDALNKSPLPADRFVKDWWASRRYAGSKDRSQTTERVYAILRRRSSFAWRMQADDARSLVIASLLFENQTADAIDALFNAGAYGPKPLTDDERARIAATPPPAPEHVLGEYPEWLEAEMKRLFDDTLPAHMAAMLERAPVDLRVNTLRAQRSDLLVGLEGLNIKAKPSFYSPYGIRIESAEGLGALQHMQFFQTGAFEFQDEASQIVAILCAAKPNTRVLDLAAGAGGKTLALAAIMQNLGIILAFDGYPERMKPIRPRARRAGANIITIAEKHSGPGWGTGQFQTVLVDAPCSGSGTWRRSPELKWTLTPERLQELNNRQASMLEQGARHTADGGRLIYAVCSMLPSEGEDRIEAFLAANPKFRLVPAEEVWAELELSPKPPGMAKYFRATPLLTATDGFFASVIEKLG